MPICRLRLSWESQAALKRAGETRGPCGAGELLAVCGTGAAFAGRELRCCHNAVGGGTGR